MSKFVKYVLSLTDVSSLAPTVVVFVERHPVHVTSNPV